MQIPSVQVPDAIKDWFKKSGEDPVDQETYFEKLKPLLPNVSAIVFAAWLTLQEPNPPEDDRKKE